MNVNAFSDLNVNLEVPDGECGAIVCPVKLQ